MAMNKRQSGMTLTELLVVITVMAILLGVSVPTVQHLRNSFESSTGVRHLINAALSNARAIAVRNQAYAGVRFQEAADGLTYMTFILHDEEATGYANGFRAVIGRNPMPLPEGVSVSKCSVVFSPAGKLTVHDVRVRNKDGVTDDSSNDTIFNTQNNVNAGKAQFVQDPGGLPYNFPSIQNFVLNTEDSSSIEYISPYTGELVMEYREESP